MAAGAEGIRLAQQDKADWVFHVDTDELMYPAGVAEFSLQAGPDAPSGPPTPNNPSPFRRGRPTGGRGFEA